MAPNKTSLALLFVDKKTVAFGVIILIAAFVLGILIGYFGKSNGSNSQVLEDSTLQKYTTDPFQNNQVQIDFVLN